MTNEFMGSSEERIAIGERSYMIDGGEPVITVRFYLPVERGPAIYHCEYELVQLGEAGSISYAAGVDAIDAIDNAFWMAGTRLAGISESMFGGKLRWEASQAGKPIGLPCISGDKYPFKDY